ncbi:MAG: M20/M25/M40 family metallo-hydrolase, partial [Vicinamibacterales bacterium]
MTTRTFLSAPMLDVHRELGAWMTRVGMSVGVDAAGNLRGVYPSSSVAGNIDPRRFYLGSHLDTVPNAGAFDGVLGVVMAIAVVGLLDGRRLPFAIEVVGFSDEEGVRFGVPFIGSRALSSGLDEATLDRRDAAGQRLVDVIRSYGLDPTRLADARATEASLGYLEFHIEQGPILESLDRRLGIVDAIVGQSRYDVTFDGMAGHAGTTPMSLRRDALTCASEWILVVEQHARTITGLAATVGSLDVEPGASNVIAG